jgi:putative nucleotidyltransferase with HDIG domain
MTLEDLINDKIDAYKPKGGLDHTAKLFIALCSINHSGVKQHISRVGLLCEAVAIRLEKDAKAAFFGGLLHDIGKLILPSDLFCDKDITAEEYERIKSHALSGFKALKDFHSFTALCAGLHHALYKRGYGLSFEDFPKDWGFDTIKKVLEISVIISICDFIDAFTHRKTKIKDGSDKDGNSLKDMLDAKYQEDRQIIRIALEENEKLLETIKQFS